MFIIQKHIPSVISLQITKDCDLNCPYCYVKHSTKHISFKDIQKIFDILNPDQVLIGGGEPCLNPHIEDIINYLALEKKIEHIALTTNGRSLFDSDKSTLENLGGIALSYHNNDKLFTESAEVLKDLDVELKVINIFQKDLKENINILDTIRDSFNTINILKEYGSSDKLDEQFIKTDLIPKFKDKVIVISGTFFGKRHDSYIHIDADLNVKWNSFVDKGIPFDEWLRKFEELEFKELPRLEDYWLESLYE